MSINNIKKLSMNPHFYSLLMQSFLSGYERPCEIKLPFMAIPILLYAESREKLVNANRRSRMDTLFQSPQIIDESKKRKNLEDFFCEFITNYDEQKQIAENLDIFADDVDRYIEEKTNQKTSLQKVIESNEKQLAKAREDAKQVLYPETIFYPDEKTEITSLDREKLTAQKEEIKNCGYQVVQKELSQLIRNEELKKQKSVIKEIIAYWETKGESIQRAVKAGLSKNTDTISTLETKLRKLNGLTLSKETIFQDGESVIVVGNDGFTQSGFDADKKAIKEKEKKVKDLSAEIELLSKNNKMLRLLSSLSANKQIVIDYRNTSFKSNGVVRCPICGSESFATVEEALIMREADNYIKQNGEAVMGKEADITSLQKEIDLLYQKIINRAKSVVEKEKEILETEISNLKILKDEIQPYFDDVRKIQKSNGNISIEEITTEKARELLNDVESALLEDSKEQEVRDAYQEIVHGYKSEGAKFDCVCTTFSAPNMGVLNWN